MTLIKHLESIINLFIQLFIIFPYSALTNQRLRNLPPPPVRTSSRKNENTTAQPLSRTLESKRTASTMISETTSDLCTSSETVSSLLSKDPSMAPGEALKKLERGAATGKGESSSKGTASASRNGITSYGLKRASACGNWGPTRPSELFLQMYHDALLTLDESASGAMVSPSLMGSSGVIPLTIISVVPDIMRHMSNMIVRAEKEVVLATNYWQNSVASKYITNAMKELSRRAGERCTKIIFKLEYDRGSPKQLLENHYTVSEKEYTGKAVAIPEKHEIPNIDLQVINYHKPMLGTFHCKYMIVDRKFAVLQSNNIQDNDNLEMMTHIEGPIVDSLYDMALISWHKKLEPPLPSHSSPATQGGVATASQSTTTSVIPQANEASQPLNEADTAAKGMQQTNINNQDVSEARHHGFEDKDIGKTERLQENARAAATTGDVEHIVHRKPSSNEHQQKDTNADPSSVAPSATSDRDNHHQRGAIGPDTATKDFFSSKYQTLPESVIEHPSSTINPLPEHTADDPHYDHEIAGEVSRVQTAVSPKEGESRMEAITRHLNHTKNIGFEGNVPECSPGEEMTPYIPHPIHEPFPIAMVCRQPYGTPNNKSVYNPQNEAWLSALRNAKKNVFIQSPTLNAEPLLPAIIEACERGIDVFCYVCLGYNDTGELLPMQGGHNDMIAHHLYTHLSPAGKSRLHWFWYVAKDQTAPIIAKQKKRSCHVKVMIVDEHIGIQGNGNQDTQSWFHSQEINIMFDSKEVCKAWIDGLRRAQNTHLYGSVGKEDGVWRDAEGHEPEGAIGIDPGRFSWAKGFMGAINRVRGTGDF